MGTVAVLIVAGLAIAWFAARNRARKRPSPRHGVPTAESTRVGDTADAWEGGFWDASDPRDLKTLIELTYTDGQGSTTTRVVRSRSFDDTLYGGILIGHCYLRDATRSFRFDRVQQAVDVSTGEVIHDLKAHLNRLYAASPQRARDTLVEEYRDILKILYFVAKADGQFREAEKVVVRSHLRELVGDPRLTDEMIDHVFQGMDLPSLQAFKLAVGRVLSHQLVDPLRLQRMCQEIVGTQKASSPGEQEALQYIAARLGR